MILALSSIRRFRRYRGALKKHRDSVSPPSPPCPPPPVGFIYLFHVQRQRSRGIFITWEGEGGSGPPKRHCQPWQHPQLPARSLPPPLCLFLSLSLSLSLSLLSELLPERRLILPNEEPVISYQRVEPSSASRRRSSSSTIRQGRR